MPPALQPPGSPHRSLQAGQRVSVLCSLVQGDEPVVLAWQKDGTDISDQSLPGVAINQVDHDSILRIQSLTAGHAGNYSCLASNAAGTAAISAVITVQGQYCHS